MNFQWYHQIVAFRYILWTHQDILVWLPPKSKSNFILVDFKPSTIQCSVDSATWCLYNQVKTMNACCLPGFADSVVFILVGTYWVRKSSISEIWVYKTTALVFKIFTTSSIFLKPHTIATSDFITTYYFLCTTNIIIISSLRCDMWLRPWTLVTKPRWLFMLPGTQKEPFGSDRETGEESGKRSNVSSWLVDVPTLPLPTNPF